MQELETTLPNLILVAPDVERDAPFAVEWFLGEAGKTTLLLMGNEEANIGPTSLEKEKEILEGFIDLGRRGKQQTWMMRYDGKTIGAVWVELEATKWLSSPAIHIMIGDPLVRGKGIGEATLRSVINFVKSSSDTPRIYSRYLVSNKAVAGLLEKLRFTNVGVIYQDGNLTFQNVVLELLD